MVYRIMYKGNEVLRISSSHKLSMQELIMFAYGDPRAAYDAGVPGFYAYGFDFDRAELRVTDDDPDDNDDVQYFCRYC